MASSLPLARTLLNSAGKSLSRQLKLNYRMIQYFNGFYSVRSHTSEKCILELQC